ncbi:MAG: bifunctional DNA-binding transcriptional regulator/O6-methylguanine-DNA methyltransferase Ada [Terriglobia bacterium]|jgi:AraC family transcriptional regulator of adaptative response/methylated-DNA-[protein]-cysteine methyltransferase|nr:bifunctional DNA-binding transcriptional regulator/O6-methylguanine-DNA methyltransferase Ada [Terriglobia bacterium]
MMQREETRWKAVQERDKRSDGSFVYGVLTTGVYCRPSCSSRQPLRENVRFFASGEDAKRAGLRACRKCRPDQPREQGLVHRASEYIREHLDAKLDLARVAKAVGVSPFALHRRFKSELGISPRQFVESCRLGTLKSGLKKGANVTRAMMDAGYSSTSRLYEQAQPRLGMAPRQYAAGAEGLTINYSMVNTELGEVVVASTEKGICCVQFLDGSKPETALAAEFPRAMLVREDRPPKEITEAIRGLASGSPLRVSLPIDLRGTLFQQRVWQELRKIPAGTTRSYAEVAEALGRPTASRAVARACATNHVAMLVPCHRVVRGDGNLSGYRWGAERKRELLEAERTKAESTE